MSAFNTVSAPLTCPRCGHRHDAIVQFKYGVLFQFQYRIGDRIRIDKKAPLESAIVADGVVESPCTQCDFGSLDEDEWNAYVLLTNDVISSVRNSDGSVNFGEEYFVRHTK